MQIKIFEKGSKLTDLSMRDNCITELVPGYENWVRFVCLHGYHLPAVSFDDYTIDWCQLPWFVLTELVSVTLQVPALSFSLSLSLTLSRQTHVMFVKLFIFELRYKTLLL